MAKIKSTLSASDCDRYGANLMPTNKVKFSFPDIKSLIGLTVDNFDSRGNKSSNVEWAEDRNGEVAPLDAVRKCQTRILWTEGFLLSDTDAITEDDLRFAESRIQEKLGWI